MVRAVRATLPIRPERPACELVGQCKKMGEEADIPNLSCTTQSFPTSKKATGSLSTTNPKNSSAVAIPHLWPKIKSGSGRRSKRILGTAHCALRPVNLVAEGIPHCVCPVRTADKNDGSARFVHNSRRVNKNIPSDATKCELESLLRARNIFIPDGFVIIGLDFASGYHCISMDARDRKFLPFALHVDEFPDEAVE